MKFRYQSIVATFVGGLAVLVSVVDSAQASAITQRVTIDMKSFVMPDVQNLHQNDVLLFKIGNLPATKGVWVGVCNAAVIAAKPLRGSDAYVANCDQTPGSSALLSMDKTVRPTSALANKGVRVYIHTTFGTTNCVVSHCVLYVVSDAVGADLPLMRAVPLYFSAAIQHITVAWPTQSNIVKGSAMSLTSQMITSDQTNAHLRVKTLLPEVCTVTAIAGGWQVDALKIGTCKLQVTALADTTGVWLAATSLRGYSVTAQ